MGKFSQAGRPLVLTTPLGADVLLLEELSGTEGLSELFQFRLSILAEAPVPFDGLLGKAVSVALRTSPGVERQIHGIVRRLGQGGKVAGPQGAVLWRYWADVVPAFWRLTQRTQSRIFQALSVPEILKRILVDEWRLEVVFRLAGNYPHRNYCVQYRESDFAFVSRLMEEEGIAYFFEHTADGHRLVVSDPSTRISTIAEPHAIGYDDLAAESQTGLRIREWSKFQALCADVQTLADYHFELPDSRLSAQQTLREKVSVGSVTHTLRQPYVIDKANMLEAFDYPGGFAHHFDGVGRGGGDEEKALEHVFDEAHRVAQLRSEAEATQALEIHGRGNGAHFTPGYQFTLAGHVDGDGDYLLTRVEHSARQPLVLDGATLLGALVYQNQFDCLPLELPYRPRRRTPKPTIAGTQTAVVVGPKDSRVFVDKFGRVKVQFRWDRHGPHNADSSCWVRVSQAWAGKHYGAFFWPRPGHEVVVAFEEGDPDRPIIVGSVYNAANLPPYELPKLDAVSGIVSCSLGGNPAHDFNGVIFHDVKGDEHLQLHSQMQLVQTGEAGTFHATPGPKIEVSGLMPIPTGSGSGGGFWEWPTAALSPAGFAPWNAIFPGAEALVCGDRVGVALFGNNYNHVIGGSNVGFVVDLEQLLADTALGPFGHVAAIIGGAIGGASGNVGFALGDFVDTTYGGDKLSVSRGSRLTYDGKWKGQKWPERLAYVLALATAAVGSLSDASARIIAAAKRPVTRDEDDTLAFGVTLPSLLTSRLHGILIGMEKRLAAIQAANKKANEALGISNDAQKAAIAALMLNSGVKLEDAKNRVESAAARIGQAADIALAAQPKPSKMDRLKAAVKGKWTAIFSRASADQTFTHDGSYTVQASENISITAENSDNKAQDINIVARGSGDNGIITLEGTSDAIVLGAKGTAALSLNNKGAVLNTTEGTLLIAHGKLALQPQIELTDSAMTLSVGGPLGAVLELQPTSLTMRWGTGNRQASIILNSAGVTISGWNINESALGLMQSNATYILNKAKVSIKNIAPKKEDP